MTRDAVTLVVGAGVAGLTAAYRWRQRGEPVVLVEKQPFTGGAARSIHQDGFIFDIGPHYIFSRKKLHNELFRESEIAPIAPTIDFVIDGKWIRYPFGPSSLVHLPLGVQWDFLRTRAFGARTSLAMGPPASLRHSLTHAFGPALYEYFFRRYLMKKLGGTDMGEVLHHDWWTATRGDDGQPSSAAKRGAPRAPGPLRLIGNLARTARVIPWLTDRMYYHYPRGGFGQITQRLTDRLINMRADIRLSTEVTEIRRTERRINEACVGEETLPVRRLIWTASPTVLARLAGVPPPALPTLHLIVFFITMDRRYPRRGTEVRPLDPKIPFYRCYFPERLLAGLTPGGRSGVVAEVGVSDASQLRDVERSYPQIIDACVKLGLSPRDGITGISHVTVPSIYPLYTLDYRERTQRFMDDLAPLENLLVAGRTGRMQYVNSHVVIEQVERAILDEEL